MTVKKISVAVAALGFLLMLTELRGGPWAGTFIGAALLILGALAALNARKITAIMPNKKGGAKMKFTCEFIGGHLDGMMPLERAEALTKERTEDMSAIRKRGGLCRREELDNKPVFKGYCGPMWDGMRGPDRAVLRYETWEVYNMMFD